ncbi:MAG: hypothetical protein V3T05_03970, partial [Myxococcota bacterium]
EAQPLRGAILFGNDPRGNPTGAEAFGTADDVLSFRGSEAIGAPQLVPEKLHKDQIGYDLGGRLMQIDEMSMAGIRKDPRDRLRGRVLAVLGRLLACEPDRLRHGLNEQAIPWGRLRRDRSLDKPLAEELRRWYRKAPGETLGIGHVRDLLEGSNRMHSFALHCEWDRAPMLLAVHRGDEIVAYGESAIHVQHNYFVFRDPHGKVLAYVDTLVPRRRDQTARVRTATGDVVATFALKSPGAGDEIGPGDHEARFKATINDAAGKPLFVLREERATERYFRAELLLPDSEEPIGSIEDRLRGGKIRTQVELDLVLPRALAWGLAAIAADLSRLRRRGWPDAGKESDEEQIESVEEALGKPRGHLS